MDISPSSLSLGGILEGYADSTLGGIRGKQGFNGEELDVREGCHQVYTWYIPTQFGSRTGKDMYSACIFKDRLSPTRKEKLWSKICLQPHLEQGRTPLVGRCHWSLFLSLTDMS